MRKATPTCAQEHTKDKSLVADLSHPLCLAELSEGTGKALDPGLKSTEFWTPGSGPRHFS